MTADPVGELIAPPPAHDPARLLPTGVDTVELDAHLRRVGPLPYRGGPRLLAKTVEAAGLAGRGGAAFPTFRKLLAVASGAGRKVVVANGAEGEPASSKDRVLLMVNPHLVLDGLQLAAEATGASTAYLYVHPHPDVMLSVRRALAARRRAGMDARPVKVVEAPTTFIAGEESAVVARVNGRNGLPTSKPPMVFERGVDGRPTLVQNVETLAHLALLARFGATWFRALGDADQPGTALFTVSGAVGSPGVVEAAAGTTVREVVAAAGGPSADVRAVLVGGYHGAWVPGQVAADTSLTARALAPHDARVGAGVVAVLPTDACGLVETARVVRYLAGESAGQCGPCMFGLPSIAEGMEQLAGRYWQPQVRRDVERRAGLVEGRGACHHPDGTVRLVRSALRVFAAELDRHALGTCSATRRDPVLDLPAASTQRRWT